MTKLIETMNLKNVEFLDSNSWCTLQSFAEDRGF